MPPIDDQKNVFDDFGAIDDTEFDQSNDFGAKDDLESPNALEVERQISQTKKVQAEQEAEQEIQKQAKEAADPRNWTVDQTKKYFKDNPPQNPQQEVFQQTVLKAKQTQVKTEAERIERDKINETFRRAVQPGFYEDIGLGRPPTRKEQANINARLRKREWDLLPPGRKGEIIMEKVTSKALPYLITAPAAGIVWPWLAGMEAVQQAKNVAVPLAAGEGPEGISALEDRHMTELLQPALEAVPEKGIKLPEAPGFLKSAAPVGWLMYEASKWAIENPRDALTLEANVGEIFLDYMIVKKGLGIATDLKAVNDPRVKDAFETLGIKPNATTKEAESAFRAAALRTHPDRGGNPAEFGQVNEAIKTIRGYRNNVVRRMIDYFRGGGEPGTFRGPQKFLKSQRGEARLPVPEDFKLPEINKDPEAAALPAVKFSNKVISELSSANASAEKLTDEEKSAQNWVLNNPEQARENYIKQSELEFKADNVISADIGKFAIPGMDATMSAAYHESGSALAKARETELLDNPKTAEQPVALMAGGSGSGKSNILRTAAAADGGNLQEDYALIHDANLNSMKSGLARIKRALESFRPVEITYVYRDPLLAWKDGVIPRVRTQNRIVPIKSHIETHQGSYPVVKKLVEENSDNPDFKFRFVNNSFGKGEYKILNSIDEVPLFDYTGIEDKLYELTKQALIEGKINAGEFQTAIKGVPRLESRASKEQEILSRAGEGGSQQPSQSGTSSAGLKESSPPTNQSPRSQEQAPAPSGQPEGRRRKFIQTVKDSERTLPEVAEAVESRHLPISNQETLAAAQQYVQQDYNAAIERVTGPEKPTAFTNMVAQVLVQKAQQESRIADAISLVERTAEKQTSLGQAIQALSMYNRLSPEGILLYAQRVVKRARDVMPQKERVTKFEQVAKDLSDPDKTKLANKLGVPHISEVLADELLAMANRIQELPEGRDKQIATAQMLKKIADLVPKSLWSKVSMIQTMAQLLNPKTFIRNILGNIGFQLTEGMSDTVGTALDVATSLVTKERTTFLPALGTQAKGLAQGLREGTEEALAGVNLKDTTSKFTLPKNGVFDKGVMGALEKTLRISLGATDRAFYQAAFNQSIRDQMLAVQRAGQKVNEPTEEMIERAHQLGLYRTFQDDNVISRQFVLLKRWFNLNKEWGLGDIILKYPKTPANILARGIEYSPFGFFKSVYELTKPLMGEAFNQEQFVRSTARSLTGSATLVGTGALLAGLGIISGKRAKDRDVSATRKAVGLREYQINTSALKRFMMSGYDPDAAQLREDDVLVTYDWMLPSSMGLALGANMVMDPKTNLVDRTLNFAEQMAAASETLQEQPLVQGVKRFAQTRNVAEAFTDAVKEIPASFIPTLLNQVRQLTDNTARNTRDPNYRKEIYNKAIMRMPGMSSQLPPRVTALGEDQEMYQMGTNNPFNVFLNPAFVTKYKPNAVSRMVLNIWEMSGETVQFPRVASAKIKLGAQTPEPVELTPGEYTEYQRYIGNKTDVLFTILAENDAFINLLPEKQAKKLQGYLTDINTAAKIEVLGYQPHRVSRDVLSIITSIARDKKQIDAVSENDFGAIDDNEFGAIDDQ